MQGLRASEGSNKCGKKGDCLRKFPFCVVVVIGNKYSSLKSSLHFSIFIT